MNRLITFVSTHSLMIAIIAVLLALLVLTTFILIRRRRRNAPKSYSTLPEIPFKKGWVLSGLDFRGNSIHLAIDDIQLHKAIRGITIGESPKLSELVIHECGLSHRQARFIYIDEALYIEDTNSLNGTWVNGNHLTPFKSTKLNSGDTLVLGDVELLINYSSEMAIPKTEVFEDKECGL
jgi:hypothetical protein